MTLDTIDEDEDRIHDFERLDRLLDDLDAIPDGDARNTATEAISILLQLYGGSLARVLHLLEDAAPEITRQLAEDPLIRPLLHVHDLHPQRPPEEQRGTFIPLDAVTRREPEREETAAEQCELCAEPLAPNHQHLADLSNRSLLCACRACALLFDNRAAGGGHYRLVPSRGRHLPDFVLDETRWQQLGVPVGLAFFFWSGVTEGMIGSYPSPAGPVESELDASAWTDIVADNPALAELQPEIEALLICRTPLLREQWIVPIDRCYALVALVREHWRGIGGGGDVWRQIRQFFEELDKTDGRRFGHAHDPGRKT